MLKKSLKRGVATLASRKIYLFLMIVVPLASALFFITLMSEGLPLKVPSGVVDLDRSTLSRRVVRNLGASELIDVQYDCETFHQAIDRVNSGEIFGFFCIPHNFERDALSGNKPTLTFYSNLSVFVPGTLAFKGFKTTGVTTMGGIVVSKLEVMGINDAQGMIQPVVIEDHPIGNPWMNYSIYLTNSFVPCMLALVVMLVTCFSICQERKQGTSIEWLQSAGGKMWVALLGKLLPQSVIFIAVGIAMDSMLYGYLHFPIHNHLMHILTATVLLVFACQAFAVAICEIVPNLRLSLSLCSLVGILSFSLAGFSFPVDQMYGGVAIFGWAVPIRYYFLIYIDQALNGLPIYYSRLYYVALLLFLALPLLGLRRLRRYCLKPIYVP